jgi:iron-sulfur cluster assembly accessory protein
MPETNPPLISLTSKAAEYAEKLLVQENIKTPPGGIRFYITAGGCSGFRYNFRAEKTEDKFDHVIICHGVRILIDRKSMKIMEGTIIDHTNNLIDPPFVFNNPKAKQSCGCGTSFELDP